MKVKLNKLAIQELYDAVAYYELELKGLGQLFREEVKGGIKRILKNPRAWMIERGEVRKYLLHKFPFKILYSIESNHIFIIAIAHQHRHPNYWIDRVLST